MTQVERDAQIDSLLADNTAGNISAKDMRDVTKQASMDIQVNTDNGEANSHRHDNLGLVPDNTGKLIAEHEIELQNKQTIPNDQVAALADNRLCTVANTIAVELVLKQYIEDHFIPSDIVNLVVGDHSTEAQLTLDAKDATASHVVFERDGVPKASIGVSVAANDQLTIEQRVDGNIKFVVPDGFKVEAKIGNKFHTFAMLDDIPTGGGGGIAPADQAKLDHITVAQDINLDSDFVQVATDVKDALVEIEGIATSEIVGLTLKDQKDGDAINLLHDTVKGGFTVTKVDKVNTTEDLLEVTPKDFKYNGDAVATEARVEELIHEYRTTVDYDTAGATPTLAECKLAALQLPHFDWSKDDDFYLRQIDRTKMALVKYRALSSSVDEATAGEFWLEKLTLVK